MGPDIVTEIVPSELIQAIQPPEIAEHLIAIKQKWQRSAEEALAMVCTADTIKQKWQRSAEEALAMVCTADTIKTVKAKRAELEKEFTDLEERRKAVKAALLRPYEEVLLPIYRECVLDLHDSAKSAYDNKINAVESEVKRLCEEGLRRYFDELCAIHHLEWLPYEQAGIKVDLSSAKAKTPAKLRRQLEDFVSQVSSSVDQINLLEDADEVMVEYQKTLDIVKAMGDVRDRRRRTEEQRTVREARNTALEQESKMVRRVEALAPVVMEKPSGPDPGQIIPRCAFTLINATRAQLLRVKKFLDMEGIQYE